jgi:hypothetical protein
MRRRTSKRMKRLMISKKIQLQSICLPPIRK